MLKQRGRSRRGAIIPMVALCSVALFGLLALAIDVGMIAVARTQAQNAADTAATAAARTINGDTSVVGNENSYKDAPKNGMLAAINNSIMGKAVKADPANMTTPSTAKWVSDNVSMEVGAYLYKYDDANPANEKFIFQMPKTSATDPYSAVRATVKSENFNAAFSRVFGASTFNSNATALSVHRPRDVCIVMDLSGSMRFQSLPGVNVDSNNTTSPSSLSRARNVSMNPDTSYPQWGPYSSSSASLYGNTSYSTGAEMVDPANISVSSNSGSPIVEDFYSNNAGVTPTASDRAFWPADLAYNTKAGGDQPLRLDRNSSSSSYSRTLDGVFDSVSDEDRKFQNNGYDYYYNQVDTSWNFAGYSEGPRYWGKTFFIWPPDPRGPTAGWDPTNSSTWADNGAKDWRQRFFLKVRTSDNKIMGGVDHTTILFNPSGTPASNDDHSPTPIVKAPGTTTTVKENNADVTYTYRVNYEAILTWLRETPRHFPERIRAGRICYYSSMPNPATTSGINNRFWTTRTLDNVNERFWREYIDFVLGIAVLDTSGGGWGWTNLNANHKGSLSSYVPMSALIGNGDYFSWSSSSYPRKYAQKPDYLYPANGGSWSTYNPTQVSRKFTGTVSTASTSGTNNVKVNSLSSTPTTGHIVRFSGHNYLYKLSSSTLSNRLYFTETLKANVAVNETFEIWDKVPTYLDPDENPYRPKHQYWFGAMTFTDFLMNYNTNRFWAPGTVHEAQCWACKVGMATAIDDIKKNHPNDFVTMCYFSNPISWHEDDSYYTSGRYNNPLIPLGRNYDLLKESLWFPPSTLGKPNAEIHPYHSDMDNVPRANGSTAPGQGFIQAYNIFSSSVNNLRLYQNPQPTQRGAIGGLGRKGAYRLVIFETDGAPNTRAHATLAGSGSNSYYPVRIKNSANLSDTAQNEYFKTGDSYKQSEVLGVVSQIVANETASSPGFSTNRRKAKVWAIGYGTLFDPAKTSTAQTNAITFLKDVCVNGNTLTSSDSYPTWLRIYGTNQNRIDGIQNAFSKIMQDGIQVTLIE